MQGKIQLPFQLEGNAGSSLCVRCLSEDSEFADLEFLVKSS